MGFLLGYLLGNSNGGGGDCCCRVAQHVMTAAEKTRQAAEIAQFNADSKALLIWFMAGSVALIGLVAWLNTEGWLAWIPGPMRMPILTTTLYPFPPPPIDLSTLTDEQLEILATMPLAPEA